MRITSAESDGAPGSVAQQASDDFISRACGEWSVDEESKLQSRLAGDAPYAEAFHATERSWQSIGAHAESPELMKLRESAIAWIRRENVRRWSGAPGRRRRSGWAVAAAAAAAAAAVVAIMAAVQFSPYGYHPGLYRTNIGQQQTVELTDHSRVDLDAATRLQVQFTDKARTVRLVEGQAQFSVAKDPTRPFKVRVGDRTLVALGTVFTVEYIDGKVRVAMVEGKVAISTSASGAVTQSSEEVRSAAAAGDDVAIIAGEELRVSRDGRLTVIPHADIPAATAWEYGNVIFRNEPLGDAVERLNRYSRLQLKIMDPSLASLRISGVFEKGDVGAFARSVQVYYPVVIDSDTESIRLRLKEDGPLSSAQP